MRRLAVKRAENRTLNGLTENDGHENDGPKMTTWHEVAAEQIEF